MIPPAQYAADFLNLSDTFFVGAADGGGTAVTAAKLQSTVKILHSRDWRRRC